MLCFSLYLWPTSVVSSKQLDPTACKSIGTSELTQCAQVGVSLESTGSTKLPCHAVWISIRNLVHLGARGGWAGHDSAAFVYEVPQSSKYFTSWFCLSLVGWKQNVSSSHCAMQPRSRGSSIVPGIRRLRMRSCPRPQWFQNMVLPE